MVDLMKYNSIKQAIPRKWKEILRTGKYTNSDSTDDYGKINMNGKQFNIAEINSKTVNDILTKKIRRAPTAIEK